MRSLGIPAWGSPAIIFKTLSLFKTAKARVRISRFHFQYPFAEFIRCDHALDHAVGFGGR